MKEQNVRENGSIFIYSEEMAWFDFGPDHPYKPERAVKTVDLCTRYGLMDYPWMAVLDPVPLDPALLTVFHKHDYIESLKKVSQGEVSLKALEHGLGTDDNPVLLGIYEWALRAAGGTHEAILRLTRDQCATAFNPLGGFHHAMPDHATGFCYINDIVIAIKTIKQDNPGIKVAFVDLDAHHCNGVQDAFYEDSAVLVFSLHETGETLYPWSGAETEIGAKGGKGYTINIPLQPGTDDEVYGHVLDQVLFPIISSFAPDIMLAEIGADALVSDPLTNLKLTNNAYQKAVKGIVELSPRVLALGGGGYDLYRTSRCWTLAWAILNYLDPQDEFAGLVGGMMFGPENEVGSLYDHPYLTKGEVKEKAMKEAQRVVDFIRKEIFPIHGL